MKTKLIVVLLSLALASAPTLRADGGHNPPPVVQKCWIEIIGVIILIGIYYCNRYGADVEPPPPKPPKKPPGTNAPPVVPPLTNTLPKVQITPGPMCSTNITANGWADTNGTFNCTFTNQVSFWIQASSDLTNWQDWIEVYQWQSASGTLFSLGDSNKSVVVYQPERLSWPTPPPGNFLRTVAK